MATVIEAKDLPEQSSATEDLVRIYQDQLEKLRERKAVLQRQVDSLKQSMGVIDKQAMICVSALHILHESGEAK